MTKPGTVEVWSIAWTEHLAQIEDCRALLSTAERTKADAFHFERDRQRYSISHAALRSLLAQHVSLAPADIMIQQNGWEKPRLEPPHCGVHFNLSHSGDLALVAISHDYEVGVDVEQIKPLPDLATLAARFFSKSESTTLFQLPAAEQTPAFFRIWTRKEAWLKARGDGLSLPLAEFDVSLEPGCTSALLATRFAPAEVTRWRVSDLPSPPDYSAALAVEGLDWTVTTRSWSGL
ncbi:MAG: hypothetical protein B9S32_06500 [Verrucomicrobia bacterium Tous-C9LFEB]|nr:MAG: hypothetical protein B9S32_06500 [Verrucomicrobia bacterium Tous-C9LFEB]